MSSSIALGGGGGRAGGSTRRVASFVLATALISAVAVGVATEVSAPPLTIALGVTALAAIAIWMFFSERQEWPLAVLAVYLGCVDGYVKLSSGSSLATLGRDVLLYAIVLGILARAALRHQHLTLPPLGGWVLAFTALVLVQLFNPADGGLVHSLGALRPHLEFVPLFFLGYQVMRTPTRLRRFFVILLVCSVANGIVNLIQYDLTPAQLSSWGPGYAADINGTGSVSGRVFVDAAGQSKVRPFGLGGDLGAGGNVGMLSIGAALALLFLGASSPIRWLGLLLCFGPPLAVITGQSRSTLIAAILAVVFFMVLATSTRRLVPALAALLAGMLITAAVINVVASHAGSSIFDRYATVTPANLGATTQQSRGGSIDIIPNEAVDYPLGGGLGSVGPASAFAGGASQRLNGETQFTFYISELGLPGLALMLCFNLRLLGGSLRRIRRLEHERRVLVAGVAAGVAGLFVEWASGPPTASSPGAPYFWFAAGILAYWLTRNPAPEGSPAALRPTER